MWELPPIRFPVMHGDDPGGNKPVPSRGACGPGAVPPATAAGTHGIAWETFSSAGFAPPALGQRGVTRASGNKEHRNARKIIVNILLTAN